MVFGPRIREEYELGLPQYPCDREEERTEEEIWFIEGSCLYHKEGHKVSSEKHDLVQLSIKHDKVQLSIKHDMAQLSRRA